MRKPSVSELAPAIAAFTVLIMLGCSHTKPYYRSDNNPTPHITIDRNDIKQRVILIGDAGEPQDEEPVLRTMLKWTSEIPQRTISLFLGDNAYPAGIPHRTNPERQESEKNLEAQLKVLLESNSRGIFIPGNHDWGGNTSTDSQNLKREENLVNLALPGDQNFLPANGCPGPVKVDLNGVRIIIMDTHWLLTNPDNPVTSCTYGDRQEFMEQLGKLVQDAGDREIIVAVHHPFATHGSHGGFFTWQDHIFPLTNLVNWMWVPLPGIGSLYPFFRWNVIKRTQDYKGRRNMEMKKQLTAVFAKNKPLIYVGGHDHSLQVLKGNIGPEYILVSGAGSQQKLSSVGHGDDTLFAHQHSGFMVIDLLTDGSVLLRVVEPGEKEVVFAKWLRERK